MATEPLNVTTQGASGVSPAGRTPLPLPPPPAAPLPPGSPANAPRDGALSTTPAPARGAPPQGGFWARAGSRGRHGRGTLPLHRLPKLGPRACPAARPRASLTTGTHAFSSGPMIVAWWKSNICHPQPPESVTTVFPNSLSSPSPEACPLFRPMVREKKMPFLERAPSPPRRYKYAAMTSRAARLCE